MIHPLRDHLNKRRFRKTKAEAEAKGHVVCATIASDGKPVYFTLPPDAPEKIGEAKAFQLRHGRTLTEGEQMLKLAAQARAVRQEA